MISRNTLKRIKAFKDSDFEILSVYLGTEGLRAPSAEVLLTQLHSLVHTKLTKEDRVAFADDIDHMQEYLQDYIPSARSLIFFSAGPDLWQVVHLEFYLEPRLIVGHSPYLIPIEDALDIYSMYLVLLVDREKVRMFTVEQGEMVDCSEQSKGYVPQVKKTTGRDTGDGRNDIDFRHNETMLKRHIEITAGEVARFTRNQDIHFVILGGHSEMFKKVRSSLPVGLRNKVLDQFVTEINIPINDIMLESKQIAASLSVA